jgi:hypothetical protein
MVTGRPFRATLTSRRPDQRLPNPLMGAASPEKLAGMIVQRIVDDAFRPGDSAQRVRRHGQTARQVGRAEAKGQVR